MTRDPFYRQIFEALKGTLDPVAFQECANDLLRAVYPTLVAMVGGTDSGMDGAIADGEGEPFPLVVTTGKIVIENLTTNLKTYLRNNRPRRKVVLATSQQLTPRKKSNLIQRATELGFTLIQIHDRTDIASLLYRNPKWCRELLNLTGDPPALSLFPRSERPLLPNAIIGRTADLAWLRETTGDRLLVGQPGSGKTFLLHQFAREGRGLFAATSDRSAIAAGIREQQPAVIIVDDAQGKRELLRELWHLRIELGAKFEILASCWPSEQPSMATSLGLPKARIRQLDLLTRDEIVEVIKASGLFGPNRLVREIVDQAEGRPGLATTLTHLCLHGGVAEVAGGDALSVSFMSALTDLIGVHTRDTLAAFAVGGDSGMEMNVIARALGLSQTAVRHVVQTCKANGVILEIHSQRLSVRPRALRFALVRDVFFTGATSLPIEQLLAQAPDPTEAALTLIGAKARGADISASFMLGFLEQAGSGRAWVDYAWLGTNEARQVCERNPNMLIQVATPLLHHIPDLIIPKLFAKAVGDHRQLHSSTDHPLRLISDWVFSAPRGTGEVLRRRSTLLKCASEWLAGEQDVAVGLQAIEHALSPRFEAHSADPGRGMTVTVIFGLITVEEMCAIQALWSIAKATIQPLRIEDWMPLRKLVEAWAYPEPPNVSITPEMGHVMASFARMLLQDIAAIPCRNAGILQWANEQSRRLGLGIDIYIDPDFEILYPVEDPANWEASQDSQRASVIDLAEKWSQFDPSDVTAKIVRMDNDAASAHINGPRWTPLLCEQIAQRTQVPSRWARTMIALGAKGDLILPFLQKAAQIQESGWAELISECLDNSNLLWAAISVLLSIPDLPEDLLTKALSLSKDHVLLIEFLCMRNQVPEQTVNRLLLHSDPAIASAAAKGEWWAGPHGTIRQSLQENWRHAVIKHVKGDHWLAEVFRSDPTLASEWLQTRMSDTPLEWIGHDDSFQAAISVLDYKARKKMLSCVPSSFGAESLIVWLVDTNLDLYRDLLNDSRLKEYHLLPLGGEPDLVWVTKAKLALDAGYSQEQVAGSVYSYPRITFSIGDESVMQSEWVARFERLCSDADDRIRAIGELGRAHAQAHLDRALGEEKREAIYGIE
jgi:hypothetical protein